MKKQLLLGAFILSSVFGMAQEKERLNEIYLNLGSSLPFGDFGSTAFSNDDASYALSGVNFTLGFNSNIKKDLYIGVLINSATFDFANTTQENQFRRISGDNIDITPGTFVHTSVNSLVGYGVSINQFSFRGHIGYGYGFLVVPSIGYTFEDGSSIFQDEGRGSNFNFMFGSKIGYNFTAVFELFISANYFFQNTTIEDQLIVNSDGEVLYTTYDVRSNFTNLNLGVAFNF